MAGVSRDGLIDLIDFSLSLQFSGRTAGIGIPFKQWETGNLFTSGSPGIFDVGVTLASEEGTITAAEQGTPATDSAFTYAGTDADDSDKIVRGDDWFEKVHALPKTQIDFGNIITQVESSYQVHSAFRRSQVTLAAIVNNALPGTQLPNMTPPLVLNPLETALDPTTTANSAGTGLGTLVQLKIQALPDGLPIFDTSVVFDFSAPATDVSIFVAGQRIVLIPLEYEAPVKETLAWLTDVIESLDGREQRIALRKHPKQILEVTYLLDSNDRQRMQAILFDWMDNVFGVPLWHERLFLTAATSPGASTFLVRNADQVDLRVGGLAAIITDNGIFDVINIATVSATQITSVSPATNGYAVGTRIMPLRTAIIRKAVTGARTHVKVEQFNVTFEVTDNNTGSVAGTTTPGFWATYNSRVLFDDNNYIEGSMREEFSRRVYRIDNETGIVAQTSIWDRNKRLSEKGFVLRNRADIYTYRQLLTALRGRQKAFYLPTFIEELTVVANLTLGAVTMDIEAIEYVRFVRNRLPMSLFKITFTDNTSLVRSVSSSATISPTVERLTLDTSWPANRTVAEIVRIQFYELVRLDADEVVINYPRIGLARSRVPVIRVFDDN